jgi:hypothetical protein
VKLVTIDIEAEVRHPLHQFARHDLDRGVCPHKPEAGLLVATALILHRLANNVE